VKLFAGVAQSDYQDVLRAVGSVLDQQRLRDVRIWEHESGLVVQGRRADGNGDGYETFLLTDDDILSIMRDAYKQREMPGTRLTGNPV
jgi:hypothetical protein